MVFKLHPKLAEDCHYLGDFPLCALLLSKDANYPWYILVPRRADITEAFQLNEHDQQTLQHESLQLSEALSSAFSADKMNIAALGNMVPQLHLHHIVRYTTDAAWPNPIWGHSTPIAYSQASLEEHIHKTQQLLHHLNFTPRLQNN
ncbi:MAG: HIT domain-containing protein [Cycloclasticus sp.]